MFRVEEIGHDRLEDLLGLLRERAAWLEKKNWKMWDASRLTIQEILKRYNEPRAYLAYDGDEAGGGAVGGFLLVDSDDHYWSSRTTPKPTITSRRRATRLFICTSSWCAWVSAEGDIRGGCSNGSRILGRRREWISSA